MLERLSLKPEVHINDGKPGLLCVNTKRHSKFVQERLCIPFGGSRKKALAKVCQHPLLAHVDGDLYINRSQHIPALQVGRNASGRFLLQQVDQLGIDVPSRLRSLIFRFDGVAIAARHGRSP
ncbi:hypothetical protein D9M71_706140 [compost metagenome]